jgi:hypothetical protein
MDREDGFPPHIVGFMRRKRAREQGQDSASNSPLTASLRLRRRVGRWPFMFE